MVFRTDLPNGLVLPDGREFTLVFFKIHSSDEQGKPEDLTMIPPYRIVELTGGEQFMPAYIPKVVLYPPATITSSH